MHRAATWPGAQTDDAEAATDRTGTGYLLDMELLRSLPARGEAAMPEDALIDDLCGFLRRAGHEERLPDWLADRC